MVSDGAPDQCWGDDAYLGASGPMLSGGIANTDPVATPLYSLRGTRVVTFLPPTDDGTAVAAIAERLADQLDAPVVVTAQPYNP